MSEGYYKILGLERGATQDEIKRVFRKLARKFHPDVSKERTAEARFKEISEAYEVLGDVEKRAAYDQLGKEWKAGEEFRPPPNWDAGFEFSGPDFEHGEFSDFFEALFGEMRGRERPFRGEARFRARGEDHHARILIDLRDAFTGAARPISLRVPEVDPTPSIAPVWFPQGDAQEHLPESASSAGYLGELRRLHSIRWISP